MQAPRLLLVYNADGGIVSMVKDAIHKIASPSTYPCSLCAITYGPLAMHGDWRRFLDSLPLEVAFHHKDDFAVAYPDHGIALPAVLLATGGDTPAVLISAEVLDTVQDTPELIAMVEEALMSDPMRKSSAGIIA